MQVLATLTLLTFAPAAEPGVEKQIVFEAGHGGYAAYRIPGVVVTKAGTALAYCEARKHSGSDWGQIDIVMRRSADGGKTWEPQRQVVRLDGRFERNPVAAAQKLGRDGQVTINNPVGIADPVSGAVHFLYCVEYGRCFYLRSDDDGRTFGKPVEITPTFARFRPEYDWKVLATGPGHGARLRTGRLVVPVWLSTGTGGHAHRPSVVSTIISDDGGATWERGQIVARHGPELVNPSESAVAELADGRVMLNIRSESKAHRRAVTFSPDGATNWTPPRFHDELPEPVCMASLLSLPGSPARLLFSNPHNLDRADGKAAPGKGRDRKNLTVKLSTDGGATWPVARALEAGPSGYSDLAATADVTVLCLYERGADASSARMGTLVVARFRPEWLTNSRK